MQKRPYARIFRSVESSDLSWKPRCYQLPSAGKSSFTLRLTYRNVKDVIGPISSGQAGRIACPTGWGDVNGWEAFRLIMLSLVVSDRSDPMHALTPSRKRVLFVCVENSNRSQMAEAFARMHGAARLEAYSA